MIPVYGTTCEICGRNEGLVKCDGCKKVLCGECRIFDIWNFGCGHGTTKAFCKKCNDNPAINIWKGLP
ncbi:MAG: hypothetical protein MUC95_01475 [Spirochaetes bacterium]|nr:hypothetical protein [Spirochaetota bacterium]